MSENPEKNILKMTSDKDDYETYKPRYLKSVRNETRGKASELRDLYVHLLEKAIEKGTPLRWIFDSCGDCFVSSCATKPDCLPQQAARKREKEREELRRKEVLNG